MNFKLISEMSFCSFSFDSLKNTVLNLNLKRWIMFEYSKFCKFDSTDFLIQIFYNCLQIVWQFFFSWLNIINIFSNLRQCSDSFPILQWQIRKKIAHPNVLNHQLFFSVNFFWVLVCIMHVMSIVALEAKHLNEWVNLWFLLVFNFYMNIIVFFVS